MRYAKLFSPITLGKVVVRNRIVLAPMGTRTCMLDGALTDRFVTYLEERAKGGAGLIIPEFTSVRAGYSWTPSLGVHSDRLIPGLSRLCDALHNYGAKVVMQLALHGGRAPSKVTGNPCIAPSSIQSPLYKEVPVELGQDEIWRLIDEWLEAAWRAKRAGFDGVEVHGGHGYLIAQFMSPHANRRTDEWGGSFRNRMRFPEAIVRGIRDRCGRDFIIGFKFSAHEHLEGGVTPDLGVEIGRFMEAAGVDYLHVSSTSSTIPNHSYCEYPSVPSMYDPEGPLVPLAAKVKGVATVPVIAAGGICEPSQAEAIIEGGHADLVAVGRAFFADPHWGTKARRGDVVRPCIKCNICHKGVLKGTEITCTVNAGLLREYRDLVTPRAPVTGKVVVVGAGPAGLEAALQASRRGHDVVLFEGSDRIGGALRLAAIPDFKLRVRRLLEYYEAAVVEADLKVVTGTRVTEDNVGDVVALERPDVVVLATGGKAIVPQIPGIARNNVFMAQDFLNKHAELELGSRVLVLGAGKVGLEVAWMLADLGKQVEVVDVLPVDEILADEHPTTKASLFHNLEVRNVRVAPGHKVLWIGDRAAEVESLTGGRRTIPTDSVIVATGFRPDNGLTEALEGLPGEFEVYLVGDCNGVRGLYEAIHEGYYLGRYVL